MGSTTKYAKMIVAGEIPAGKYVRLACKRHLDDLKQSKNKSFACSIIKLITIWLKLFPA